MRKHQASNHLVEEPSSYHDVGLWDHTGVLEPSFHEEEVLEHFRGMENKRKRSWCKPTHHHDYDVWRWWRMAEKFQNDGYKRKHPLRNGKKKSPTTMNLAWLAAGGREWSDRQQMTINLNLR